MNYNDNFLKALLKCKNKNLYLGTGNPNAKILIIGKECALNKTVQLEDYQTKLEDERKLVEENLQGWQKLVNNEPLQYSIDQSYPYKGQENKINKKLKNDQYNGGTSSTWTKYQKLYETIYCNGVKNEKVTFHENIFITELNQIPSANSNEQNLLLRKESIKKRVEYFFPLDFIQRFPVVVLACGHYSRDFNINICNLFGVEFDGQTKEVNGNKLQWYNLHHEISGKNPKLLIHTKQLSGSITNDFINEIGVTIKDFLEKL